MKITNLKNAEKVPFNIEGHKMHIGEELEVIRLKLKPGESLEIHSNPVDVVFYIIEGKGIFLTEQAETIIEKDSCFRIAADTLRGWKNNSDSNLKILVIKIL